MAIILGITAFHPDSSACLIQDGKILSFVEEERLSRVKHYCGLPIKSINYCLNENNISLKDLDYVAFNGNKYSSIDKKIIYLFKNLNLSFFKKKINSKNNNNFNLKKSIGSYAKIKYFDHHLCHVASSCFISDYDEASFLSIDGFGDFKSATMGSFKNNKISLLDSIYFPHSLGIFYHALTQFLGFNNFGDEYKVMGLSALGENKYEKELEKIIKYKKNKYILNLDLFNFQKKELLRIDDKGFPKYDNLFNEKLEKIVGFKKRLKGERLEKKHIDLSKSTQIVFEKIFFKLLNYLYELNKSDNLILSGGCSLNSLATGKIHKNTKFRNIFISPYPGDQGGAIGAALLANKSLQNINYKKLITHNINPYLGPSFNNEETLSCLKNYQNNEISFDYYTYDKLITFVTDLLIKKNIIGWFQGKMESGARALGNRSLIADPRHDDMKDLINKKIKLREEFRPFAPSVLKSEVKNWFEGHDNDIPYMNKVYKIKNDKSKLVPAVVHVDGTCRLQTVDKNINKLYFNLISNFFEKTNVPMILNTSLNENEPIVNSPIDAVEMLLRTDMDYLIINNYLIKKN